MRLLFLGDIHGNFAIVHQYIKAWDLKDAHIIQVGDFGVGFDTIAKEKRMLAMYNTRLKKYNVHLWAIRGNHDYKGHFDKDPFGMSNIHLVKDYTVLELCGKNILCIGGATSVDRASCYTRKQLENNFVDTRFGDERWWPDEVFVLDKEKLSNIRNVNILVTHTAPRNCYPSNKNGFPPHVNVSDTNLVQDLIVERYLVQEALDTLKGNNKLELHLYGHFHESNDEEINDTRHRLLDVGELWELY